MLLNLYSKMGVTLYLMTIVVVQISIPHISAQTCKTYTFSTNDVFSSCDDLPVLNSYLYWTYDSNAGSADIAFRVTGVTSSNWIAWALNPTGSGMRGAQSLVAFHNSSGAVHAYTSSVTSYGTNLAQSSLSFEVTNLRGMAPKSDEMIIFATVKPPLTTVNQVWQVGPLSGGTPGSHAMTDDHKKSVGNINFLSGQTTSTGNAPIRNLHKKNVHGVLNAVSWGIMMPMGAIIARYMKVFKSADPAWFYLHVTCQFSAYVVGVAGWGTGLKLGSLSDGIVYHSHRNIGIALFCLATLQVFALLLRPKTDHKYRLYWNIYHHLIGYTTIILSVINIYKGLDILDPEKKWKTTYTAIIIALGAIALALEASTWLVVLKRKKSDSDKHGRNGVNGTNGYNNGYGARTQPVV